MKMFISTTITGFSAWVTLLANDVNIILAFLASLAVIFVVASIITKIDFGYWNPL